jgi:hypothetical protein
MSQRVSARVGGPLGLVAGGLVGIVLGQAIGDPVLWMILGAGGGLAIGAGVGAVATRRD